MSRPRQRRSAAMARRKRWGSLARWRRSTSRSWPSSACSTSSTAALRVGRDPALDGRPSCTGVPTWRLPSACPSGSTTLPPFSSPRPSRWPPTARCPSSTRSTLRRESTGRPSAPRSTRTKAPSRRRRVELLTGLLADHGYEPHAVGSTITLRNCPFHALAEEHRALDLRHEPRPHQRCGPRLRASMRKSPSRIPPRTAAASPCVREGKRVGRNRLTPRRSCF